MLLWGCRMRLWSHMQLNKHMHTYNVRYFLTSSQERSSKLRIWIESSRDIHKSDSEISITSVTKVCPTVSSHS